MVLIQALILGVGISPYRSAPLVNWSARSTIGSDAARAGENAPAYV
jgi:hypothetical protein